MLTADTCAEVRTGSTTILYCHLDELTYTFLVENKVLREYNLPSAKILQINTNEADSNRSPAFAKAIMALDVCDADLIIARGRLGLPGSGSLLLFVDNKGRILTCGTSPSHAISQKTLEDAVYEEANEALQKIGFKKEG